MKKHLTIILLAIVIFSCSETKETTPIHTKKMSDTGTTTCMLIEKDFTNKGVKVTLRKEIYLRCSVQDYFIKLCESSVGYKKLRPYIDSGIEVEMEIKDGMWDHCDDNPAHAQSRTGTYVVIRKLIK